jgi:Calpain family cysteine protease
MAKNSHGPAPCDAQGRPFEAPFEVAMSRLSRPVKTSRITADAEGNDLLANVGLDDPLLLPVSCSLNASLHPATAGVLPVAQVAAARALMVRTAAPINQVLYLQEAGDTALISVRDINQGQMGDCFLLSSIGEIALFHPNAIMNMITVNPNGTETVTLYTDAWGRLPTFGTTSFKPISVTVSNDFPTYAVNNGAAQDVFNGQKEIWVQVLEKAVATLSGGYNGIAFGGNPMIAMEMLVGQPTTWMSPVSLTLPALQSYIAAGELIVMDTGSSSSLPYGLVANHAYMFESLTMVGGTPMVQLGNPWGFNQPSLIPLSQLSRGIAEVDIGHFASGNGSNSSNNVISGSASNDAKTLTASIVNGIVDLGAGQDTLVLANGANSVTVANTETIIGGTGDDTIVLSTAAVGTSVNLGAGNDKLTLGNFVNTATVAYVETITGGSSNDSVTVASALTTAMQVDLGAGSNRLTLVAVGNAGTVRNVNTLVGGSGADTMTLATALINGSVDLGTGTDSLTLANDNNSASVANVEALIGGSGDDTITLTTPLSAAMSVDLGGGNNRLTLAAGGTGTVRNVSTLIGGAGNDTIAVATRIANGTVDLGGGSDRLSLADGGNTLAVANVEALIGGSGADAVTLSTAAINSSIDLGAGNDALYLGNVSNMAAVANVETIVGGSGNDTITLGTTLTPTMLVDLGAGTNKVTLANSSNSGTVRNVSILIGGTGTDSVTLGTAVTNGLVDLGGGSDTLTLANAANSVTVMNTETVIGGTGNDTIVLSGNVASQVSGGAGMNFITGGTAADTFVFDQSSAGSVTRVMNFSTMNGDKIALDTTGSNVLGHNTYDLGGAPLTLNADLVNVANATARLHTTLANHGKGGFAFEQDNGQLYYSSNGSFAGGGTLIGIITTDGTHPWAFNVSSFIQV